MPKQHDHPIPHQRLGRWSSKIFLIKRGTNRLVMISSNRRGQFCILPLLILFFNILSCRVLIDMYLLSCSFVCFPPKHFVHNCLFTECSINKDLYYYFVLVLHNFPFIRWGYLDVTLNCLSITWIVVVDSNALPEPWVISSNIRHMHTLHLNFN